MNNLAHGQPKHENMIDPNGVEIKKVIKNTRRGGRWDDNNDAVNLPPEVEDSDDIRDVDSIRDVDMSSTSARCPRRRTSLFAVTASLLAFASLVGIGYGHGYAISSGKDQLSSGATVSSSMMEAAADTTIPTYSPTYSLVPTSSPVGALRSVEVIASNGVDPGMLILDGDPWRGRMRSRGL